MAFDVNTIPNLLDIVFKGLMIGIIASAPMGPVGVLCVQRTLNKGRWYGFVTGCGAALSDIIYAGITGLGMGMVVELVSNDTNRFYLQIAGSLMLLAFGVFTYRTDPTKKMRKPGQNKGTLTHNGITAFLVTLSNPLIIFLFMALYAQFSFGLQLDKPIELVAGFISINAPRPQTAYMEVHAAGPGASVVCKCYRPVRGILHTVKGICREEYFTVLPSCCQKHGSCLCGIGELFTLDNSRVLCRDDLVRPGAFVLRVIVLRIPILRF